jgi:hypothetical protein
MQTVKTLTAAAAVLAFTAGTAAAMGGCGSYKSATVASLDHKVKSESVQQSKAPETASSEREDVTRVQTASKPKADSE